MFKTRRIIRIVIIYLIVFFLITFCYLSKLETNETKSQIITHRLAVIVPYRNRSSELEIFLPHMNSFLNSQSIEHIFMIINQADTHRFNRAALINIGFIESRFIVDYIVMHDVDLLPLNYRELSYKYPENGPIHLASPEYHPIYHYPTYVGGILMISCKDFERVNGMSPLYWGWGREDDNFYVRIKLAGMKITRPSNLSTNYTNTFRHIHDKGVHKRDYANYGKQKEEGRKIYPELGFNTTKYKIISKEIKKTNTGIEYIMLNVNIYCDYNLTSWCDHPTNISKS
jgi:xylosylprotein 4-beta-galactosyltransferase